ncbi:hypothetical protein DRQ50_12000 [bacterium]|nr:MAG: hypothetical protein DRQ50_12000 [bacterium]
MKDLLFYTVRVNGFWFQQILLTVLEKNITLCCAVAFRHRSVCACSVLHQKQMALTRLRLQQQIGGTKISRTEVMLLAILFLTIVMKIQCE